MDELKTLLHGSRIPYDQKGYDTQEPYVHDEEK